MSLRQARLVLFGNALLVCLASVFATREYLRARSARQRLELLQQDRARWQQRIGELETARQQKAAAGPTRDKPLEAVTSPHPDADEKTPASQSTDTLATMHLRALEADAQLNLDRFFRLRGLSPEQASAVIRRVAELNRGTLDLANELTPEVRSNPSHPAWTAFKAKRDEAQARFNTDMIELLSPEGYEEYQTFQRTLPHWSHVTSLASQLFRTDTPLHSTQATQLAQIIIANATTAQGVIARNPSDWDLVFTQARTILSPSQFSMFTSLKERNDLHQQMNRMIFSEKKKP